MFLACQILTCLSECVQQPSSPRRPVRDEKSAVAAGLLRVASGRAWSVLGWSVSSDSRAGQSWVETRSRSGLIKVEVVPQLGGHERGARREWQRYFHQRKHSHASTAQPAEMPTDVQSVLLGPELCGRCKIIIIIVILDME